jgi:putative ABC transport system permease protein
VNPLDVVRGVLVRVRSLLRPGRVDAELDEELHYHLEREAGRLAAGGLPMPEAQLAARRSFGNVGALKEASRDARGVRAIEQLVRDLRAGVRLALRQPGFSAVVVLSLALGLGATTATFSLTWNVLAARLAVPHPEQLAVLAHQDGRGRGLAFSRGEYRALSEGRGVGPMAAMRTASQIPVGLGERRAYVNMHFVEGTFFPLVGVHAVQGRLIAPGDDGRQASDSPSASFPAAPRWWGAAS